MGTLVEKLGYTKKHINGLKELTSETILENVVKKIKGNYINDDKVFLSTTNAIFYSYADDSIDGKKRGIINKEALTVICSDNLESTEGTKYFNYYIDERGDIVSYSDEYWFNAYTDTILTPVFSSNIAEKQNILHFMGKGCVLDYTNNQIKWFMRSNLLNDCEKIKWRLFIYNKIRIRNTR